MESEGELQFNKFMAFVPGRLPFPLAQCVLRSLNKQGVTTLNFYRLYCSVGRDQHFRPHTALNVHGAREAGILRSDANYDFAGYCGVLGRCATHYSDQERKKDKRECDSALHRGPVLRIHDKGNVIF